jgi:hypothetical protein
MNAMFRCSELSIFLIGHVLITFSEALKENIVKRCYFLFLFFATPKSKISTLQ